METKKGKNCNKLERTKKYSLHKNNSYKRESVTRTCLSVLRVQLTKYAFFCKK